MPVRCQLALVYRDELDSSWPTDTHHRGLSDMCRLRARDRDNRSPHLDSYFRQLSRRFCAAFSQLVRRTQWRQFCERYPVISVRVLFRVRLSWPTRRKPTMSWRHPLYAQVSFDESHQVVASQSESRAQVSVSKCVLLGLRPVSCRTDCFGKRRPTCMPRRSQTLRKQAVQVSGW